MYTFIHPTKSGGTSIADYFKIHYSKYILGNNHDNKCTDTNNPIIVVRDVESRFLSMYKYCKHGSEKLKRVNKKNKKMESLLDFVHMLKTNKQKL